MSVTVAIIATHQARIRCLLSKFIQGKVGRFQNGAVIKMTITSQFITISLMYSGEIDENKPDKEYYVSRYVGDSLNFKEVQFPTLEKLPNTLFSDIGNNTLHLYLIRHGQGTHNVLSGMKKKTASVLGDVDTSLTEQGENQIARAGKYFGLNNDRSQDSIFNSNYLFVSDLQRTKQTLAVFLLNAQKYSGRVIHATEMIVLPCSHELNYNKDGNCDGSYGQTFAGNENKSACSNVSSCDKKFTTYALNWNYYNGFYNGTRRKPGSQKKQCRNTSIISEAIDIINDNTTTRDNVYSLGGRKNKRKITKKLKKSNKLKKSKKSKKRHTRKRAKLTNSTHRKRQTYRKNR